LASQNTPRQMTVTRENCAARLAAVNDRMQEEQATEDE
jgi:hypothetical protein